MDIRVLRYFLAVAREENITKAAKTLHIAQPSLSRQLMELENELGKPLLVRGKRKVTLTEEGVLLRRRAEEIVELFDKTAQEIMSDSSEIGGELYLGGSTPDSVLSVLAAMKNAYPAMQFHFYSGDAVDVSERLDHGTLDFAVMLEPIDSTKYDFLSLPECSQWGVLMKKDDALAGKSAITRQMLREMPLILHQRIGIQQEIAHWAEVNLEQLHISATYNVVHGSPVTFVLHGLGYFLTTRNMLSPQLDDSVCFRPLNPPLPVRSALVWKKHAMPSRTAQLFLSKIRQFLSVQQELQEENCSE